MVDGRQCNILLLLLLLLLLLMTMARTRQYSFECQCSAHHTPDVTPRDNSYSATCFVLMT